MAGPMFRRLSRNATESDMEDEGVGVVTGLHRWHVCARVKACACVCYDRVG